MMVFREQDLKIMLSRGMAKLVTMELMGGGIFQGLSPMKHMFAVLDESIVGWIGKGAEPSMRLLLNQVREGGIDIKPVNGDPQFGMQRKLILLPTGIMPTFSNLRDPNGFIIGLMAIENNMRVVTFSQVIRFR